MFANHINRIHSRFIVGVIATIVFALPCRLFAQSPLTVQPSTGHVGVGNNNPQETLDVNGNINANGNIKNSGSLSVGTTAQTGTTNRFRHLNASVFAYQSGQLTGIPINAYSTVPFNSESFDTDALHNAVSNPSRLTASIAGKWLAGASIRVDGSGVTAPTAVAIRIIINGSGAQSYGVVYLPVTPDFQPVMNTSTF